MPSVPWGFWGWRPVRAAWKQLDGSRRRRFTDFWEFTVSDFRSEQQHCGFRWSEVAVTLDKQKWSSSEEKLKFRGGGDFWSVQFKRGLTQVKFASMVVLFRGESLIWFWGRHFFVQGIGGGCCCSLSEWNSCCYAVQFSPPPRVDAAFCTTVLNPSDDSSLALAVLSYDKETSWKQKHAEWLCFIKRSIRESAENDGAATLIIDWLGLWLWLLKQVHLNTSPRAMES